MLRSVAKYALFLGFHWLLFHTGLLNVEFKLWSFALCTSFVKLVRTLQRRESLTLWAYFVLQDIFFMGIACYVPVWFTGYAFGWAPLLVFGLPVVTEAIAFYAIERRGVYSPHVSANPFDFVLVPVLIMVTAFYGAEPDQVKGGEMSLEDPAAAIVIRFTYDVLFGSMHVE